MAAISITEDGDPGKTICDTVEKLNISLLVLGDRGLGRIKRLVQEKSLCFQNMFLWSLLTSFLNLFRTILIRCQNTCIVS